MTLLVSISRSGLSLPPLLIVGDPIASSAQFFVPVDGISTPDLSWRLTYAPDSAWIPSKQLMSAVLESSSLPMTVVVRGESAAHLATLKAELAAAVSQFTYTTTVTVDGQAQAWSCDPTYPQWGALSSGWSEKFMARAALVIPVSPT